MGLGDLFKATENTALKQRAAELEAQITHANETIRQFDCENASLKQQVFELASQVTPESSELYSIKQQIADSTQELQETQSKLAQIQDEITQASSKLIEVDDAVLLQSFGLYEPTFEFAYATQFKEALASIRQKQKQMVRTGIACTADMNWTVDNSLAEGKRLVKNMQKILLRAFNCECDQLVSSVKFNNLDSAEARMHSSQEAISKLGERFGVCIHPEYFQLKIDELRLAYGYQLKKQAEKEEQRRIRAELREQKKAEKELAEKRKALEKEQQHYQNALDAINTRLENATAEEQPDLKLKQTEIQEQLNSLSAALAEVDYRVANQKAGYVYIISNIGSFGENVFKIGMTRRLDPMDRIHELSGASVPFNFDVHAMIFSEDAPKLEAALHRAFQSKKLNMVNTRREFFHVTLEEIEQVVRENYDQTVDFIKLAQADQYRRSKLIHEQLESDL